MFALFFDFDSECFRSKLLQNFKSWLEFPLLFALFLIVEELWVEIEHDIVADLNHVMVELFFTS